MDLLRPGSFMPGFFSRIGTFFSCRETVVFGCCRSFVVRKPRSGDLELSLKQTAKRMVTTLIFTIALAATLIVIVLVLVGIIIYQRWRIGDQNVFIERFIRQNEEMRQKMRKSGIL